MQILNTIFFTVYALLHLLHAQAQTDFISIDCGLSGASSYTDDVTGINYVSDAKFIDSGESKTVSSDYDTDTLAKQLFTLKSFPSGDRNCYTIKPSRGKDDKYLIRATFLYANYDGLGVVPVFDLYVGPNLWDTVVLDNEASILRKEIIHTPSRNYIDVCLVNTGSGIPIISVLELRLLKNSTYNAQSKSLDLVVRSDLGSITNRTIRYSDDIYDRRWLPFTFAASYPLNTSLAVDSTGSNTYQPPPVVMETAITPKNASAPLEFYWDTIDSNAKYHLFMHFAEIELLQANQTREFNISINGSLFYGPFAPDYLSTTTVFSIQPLSGTTIEVSLYKTERSTLPPIINALEIYLVKDLPQLQTEQLDVDAVTNIKSAYKVKRNWVGDPCVPQTFSWNGLNCSNDGSNAPHIISLNLSSSRLSGEINTYISNLTSLQVLDLSVNSLSGQVPEFLSQLESLKILDLSNNSLSGSIPESLSQLKSLTVLNLKGNNLTGSVPSGLREKSASGSLTLSVDESLNFCSSSSCQTKKKNSIVIPVVASVAAVFILLLVLALLWFFLRRKKQDPKVDAESNNKTESFEVKNRQLTYSDILKITNNFERVLGKGGFGTVFHGNLDGTQVAVKMLSPSSAQGYKQFQAEVKLLMRVYHQNLTALVGYCNEGINMGLIYEYMANGNLDMHLSDNNGSILNWEKRLQIALDAAQGLEYLHSGCKPPIIHRDVKTTNILLTETFQAKLADFGLSRTFPVEGSTHVSTVVAGTPGYLDPEYYLSNWLSEKSDVYSFGIVLLEIITNRPVITNSNEKTHITQWVSEILGKGDINKMIDKKLVGDYDINSVWKFVELAMACVSATAVQRPTMNQVVMELKDCLAITMADKLGGRYVESKDSIEIITKNFDSEMTPQAR